MLSRAARNAYSWWWASHIRTKQSKWLEQNLQDMEEKVEYIVKIIDEDGDSFAQKAEMYYRKRPELTNFVEDTFRGYRALAERYDAMSRDLQSANRTIATVCPEQIQLLMAEEEDENCPATFVPPSKPSKNLPVAPELCLPKKTTTEPKNLKAPTRMMSKKGLLKLSVPGDASAAATSGMSKDEALEEIDNLQKKILGLQTEKEFAKSLYESGVAKYWEIEGEITEMQAKVNSLQDEFGIGTFIEDDEARSLMAATALKSCRESLIQLQEKHKQLDEEARVEYQKVKEVNKKLGALKENFNFTENVEWDGTSADVKELDQEVDSLEEERHDLESLRANIKEKLQVNSGESLSIPELAEKIDDLVDIVVTLQTALSSQNALVMRLRSEANWLQSNLCSLEEDKEAQAKGSQDIRGKISELEREMGRIQNFNQNVKHQNRKLQVHFTEASFSVDHLSEKLQTVKQDEEDVAGVPIKELSATHDIGLEEDLQLHKEVASPRNHSMISKDVDTGAMEKIDIMGQSASFKVEEEKILKSNLGNYLIDLYQRGQLSLRDIPDAETKDSIADQEIAFRTEDRNFVIHNLSSGVDVHLIPVAERDVPNANLERELKENENKVSLNHDSNTLKNVRMEVEAKKGDDIMAASNNQVIARDADTGKIKKKYGDQTPGASFRAEEDYLVIPNANLVERFREHDDMVACSNDSPISEDPKTREEVNDNARRENSTIVKANEEGSCLHSNSRSQLNYHSGKDQELKKQVLESEDEYQPNWRQLYLNGLDDREKILLEQYTLILSNYKETKKKLSEMEKKNHDGLLKSAIQIKELNNANALKDAEIQSLHKKLNSPQNCPDETPDTSLKDFDLSREERPKEESMITEVATTQVVDTCANSDKKQVSFLQDKQIFESVECNEKVSAAELVINSSREGEEGEKRVTFLDELQDVPEAEGKFRSDIDGLLEQNVEFWLRFSTSFHQIQKFRTSFLDLKEELANIRERMKKQDGSSKQQTPLMSEVRPIYKHLREIQTELALWLEHNTLLEDDLQTRLSSLSGIQEEISRSSSFGSKEEETELSDYQAAKFQGEVMNMKHENSKIAYKLRAGFESAKQLQVEISTILWTLEEELGISKHRQTKSSSRSKLPLRSFLFGVRLRKQKPSLFQCMNPALQKQYSDLHTLPS
ncbi:protein NETWORKED 2A-like [Diospyros lotus]|uniref:protein NETWORKED 2A-like n=1 Tax=Diospyros lotus TaxID=55363 RepID=UPI00224D5F65|nr:protein NETWORKED 2A-like [Diospyros lotus]